MPPGRGFLAFIIDWWSMSNKCMSIMPFLPRTMPPSRQVTLELRLVNKPHGTSWRHIHDFSKDGEMQPAKDDDDEMYVGNEDLRICCMLGYDRPVLEQIVDSNKVTEGNKLTVYFVLDFAGRADDLPVMLSIQNQAKEFEINFIPRFVHTADDSSYQPSSSSQVVPEAKLDLLARHVPHHGYYNLSYALGIGYSEAQFTLARHKNDHTNAIRERFAVWKDRTGGSLTKLKEILYRAGLSGLSRHIDGEDYQSYQSSSSSQSHKTSFEEILKAVALMIVTETDFLELGRAMGYSPEETRSYINKKSTYDYTYHIAALQMLEYWRESTQRSQLKLVLQKADFLDHALGLLTGSDEPHTAASYTGYQTKQLHAVQDDDMTAPPAEKGKQILLEDGRIVVTLPPGELKDGRKVTVRTMRAETSGLELRENDAVIAVGLQFSPSGIQFDQGKTVKVTMPHCGIFTKPDEARIVLYINKGGSTQTVDEVSSSVDKYPRCVVRAKDLDLYIDHFCVYLITAAVDKLRKIFIGKRLKCTPDIRERIAKDNKDCIDLYLRDDDGTEMDLSQNMKLRPRQLTVLWWKGPLTIQCSQDKKSLPEKTVEESQFYYKTENCVTFVLKLQGIQDARVLMEFILKQQLQSDTVDIVFPLNLHAKGTTRHQANAQSRSGSTASCTDLVTDELLTNLCKHIPTKNYNELSNKLGIEYTRATGILMRFNDDYERATRECLDIWKNKTGGSLSELSGILQAAELGNLRRHLPQDGFDDVLQRHPAPRHRDNQGRVAPRYNALSLRNLIIPILLAVIVYLVYNNSSK